MAVYTMIGNPCGWVVVQPDEYQVPSFILLQQILPPHTHPPQYHARFQHFPLCIYPDTCKCDECLIL